MGGGTGVGLGVAGPKQVCFSVQKQPLLMIMSPPLGQQPMLPCPAQAASLGEQQGYVAAWVVAARNIRL